MYQQYLVIIKKSFLIGALFISSLLGCSVVVSAAEYSVFTTLPFNYNDGLSFDREGNLYVSHAGFTGTSELMGVAVRKISPDGTDTIDRIVRPHGP